MTFINAMINGCDHLEQRVSVRTEFLDLDFKNVIQSQRLWVDQRRATGDHLENMSQLVAQFDVFEEAMQVRTR